MWKFNQLACKQGVINMGSSSRSGGGGGGVGRGGGVGGVGGSEGGALRLCQW